MTRRGLLVRMLGAVLLVGATGLAQAQLLTDAPPPQPQEGEVALPPLPREENLVPFMVGPTRARNSFFIDRASVMLTDQGVMRYTVVIRTDGGAQNIIYEGMNCTRSEVRNYAYAGSDGKWMRARDSDWSDIRGTSYNGYRTVLARDAWCVGAAPAISAEEALRKLSQQRFALDPVFGE